MIQGIISNLILINSDTHFANDNTFISHFKYQFTRFDTLLNWTLNFAKKKKKEKNARGSVFPNIFPSFIHVLIRLKYTRANKSRQLVVDSRLKDRSEKPTGGEDYIHVSGWYGAPASGETSLASFKGGWVEGGENGGKEVINKVPSATRFFVALPITWCVAHKPKHLPDTRFFLFIA